jgi:hypothetical protein
LRERTIPHIIESSKGNESRRIPVMKKTIALSACVLLLAALSAGAQTTLTHAATGTPPKVDGTIAASEYAVTAGDATFGTSLSWIGDTLYVAITAKTTGWVAIGLGSTRMSGAIMYMGFVTGAQTQMKVQVGAGHAHSDTAKNAPLQYKMTETGGTTVLEVALKAADFITASQKSLDMILAYGGSDSFISLHRAKASLTVTLAR